MTETFVGTKNGSFGKLDTQMVNDVASKLGKFFPHSSTLRTTEECKTALDVCVQNLSITVQPAATTETELSDKMSKTTLDAKA